MGTLIGIYKITNPIGQIYIGQSTNISNRFSSYKNSSKTIRQGRIHDSLLKYGYENHIFQIIEECIVEELRERERYWQDFYNVTENGLNFVLTGTKEKKGIHLSHSKRLKGEGNPMFGKTHSQEVREKISKKAKEDGKFARENNPMFGKVRPEVGVRNAELKGKRILNTKTNEVYTSAVEASKLTGISLSTIKRSLYKKYSEKYNLKYAS